MGGGRGGRRDGSARRGRGRRTGNPAAPRRNRRDRRRHVVPQGRHLPPRLVDRAADQHMPQGRLFRVRAREVHRPRDRRGARRRERRAGLPHGNVQRPAGTRLLLSRTDARRADALPVDRAREDESAPRARPPDNPRLHVRERLAGNRHRSGAERAAHVPRRAHLRAQDWIPPRTSDA